MDDIEELAKVWQTACEQEIEQLKAEIAKLKAETNKWRKYHDHQVELKRTLHNEYCKLRKEYMEWKETATSLQAEIAKLKQIIAAYKENSDEADGDFKEGRSAIVDLVESYEQERKQLNAEIAKLRDGYQQSSLSSKPCPGCVYRDGVFVRHCKLHTEIERLYEQVDKMMDSAKRSRLKSS